MLLIMGIPDAQAATKTFKVGVVMPLSGQLSADGIISANGVKLAAEELNAKGGVKVGGEIYKIEVLTYDDQGTPKESVAAMEKLSTRDQVKMVIGSFTSSSTFAMLPIAAREKVVLCSPVSAADKLTQVGNKWFFRGGPSNLRAPQSVPIYLKELGIKTSALLCVNDDYGRNICATQKVLQEKYGIKVLSQDYFDHGTTDFYSVLTKMKGLKPDAIVGALETKANSIFSRQAREIAPEIKLFEVGGSDPSQILKLIPEVTPNMYFISRGPGMDYPKGLPLVKRYRERFKAEPSVFLYSGYDVMMVFAKALERAGTVTDSEKIHEAMTKTNYDGIMGHYDFDETNENNLSLWKGDYKGGKVNVYPIKLK